MKRLTSFFLLFAYLLSSPGLVYSLHFCGQALTAVTVAEDADKHCCCQDAGTPDCGCCHDQQVVSGVKDLKLTATHFLLQVPDVAPAPAVLQLVCQLTQLAYPTDEPAPKLGAHAAPPPDCPAYVRGHAFLI
ncbi:HYC_CC_PP family protein [Hymenobacter glaciei]|uniref:HYC_CC_PP family protein n=1 Tax=Hymenobacter glaciei TaxID=877209 RepID=UPI0031EB3244